MPQIFKFLATLTAWVLFVFGSLSLLGGFGRILGGAPLDLMTAYFGFGVGSLFLSAVTMIIRKKME